MKTKPIVGLRICAYSWMIVQQQLPRPLEAEAICQALKTKGFDALYLEHPEKTGDALLITDDPARPASTYFVLTNPEGTAAEQLIPGDALVVGADRKNNLTDPKHTLQEVGRRVRWIQGTDVVRAHQWAYDLSRCGDDSRKLNRLLERIFRDSYSTISSKMSG